jgi:microcystin-dependent protein
MFGGNFAPRNWALCNGQLLPITQNQALYSILGTTYGGNGTTNFALPNLQGRVPKHPGSNGSNTYTLGESLGSDSVTLSANQLPPHLHPVYCDPNPGDQSSPSGHIPATESTGTSLDYSNATPGPSAMNPNMIGPNSTSSQPVSTIPPYTCVNFIIALVGIFPTRS